MKLFIKNEIKIDQIEWKRLRDLSATDFEIFQGTIEINDIIQGNFSNCYFLSTCAALTEFPDLIYQKFLTKTINPEGYYEILFFIDGEWQIVYIDDYLPFIKGTENFAFTKPRDTELWVILQKAWAKINGGYANTFLGAVSDPLNALTGCSIEYHQANNIEKHELQNKLKNANEKSFIFCTGTNNEDNVEEKGLIKGHAYGLISAMENRYESNNIKLVKLYNPWVRREWTGEWSDKSDLWKDELIKFFDKTDKDDETFFMEIGDY